MKYTLAFFISFFSLANAQEVNVVAVGEANREKTAIAFNRKSDGQPTKKQSETEAKFMSLLKKDFSFYKQFFKVTRHPKDALYVGRLHFTHQKIAIDYTASLKNQKTNQILFESKGTFNKTTWRTKGHTLASKIYTALTGKTSVFQSQIVFVSNRDSTKKRLVKELYIMDFNGEKKTRLTYHSGIVLSPAVSPDSKTILYSLIKGRGKKRNINLYTLDRATRKSTLLSKRKGINSGGVFTPDGKSILLTLSYRGNAEIYKMNLKTKHITALTRNAALDVDPSLSTHTGAMAFLSGRSGEAHIYTLDPSGVEKNVRRISFVGRFNATPRFSPNGQELAFASWIDRGFDIVRIAIDGKNLVRLTKDFGSNEDPTYSNDGQFIAFSSKRVLSRKKAVHNIYAMTRDGEIIGPLTTQFGKCITPRWAKR